MLDTARHPVIIVAADATKGHHEHVVPMSAFVLTELRLAGMPSSGFMFTLADGRPGLSPATVSNLANKCLHESGTDATLHQLRHRCLTLVQQERHDTRMTQEIAGHASPASTAIYTQLDQGDAAAVMECLPSPGRLRAVG